MVMAAPEMTAPEGSRTTPRTVAFTFCALTGIMAAPRYVSNESTLMACFVMV